MSKGTMIFNRTVLLLSLFSLHVLQLKAQTGVPMGGCKEWRNGGWVEVPCGTSSDDGGGKGSNNNNSGSGGLTAKQQAKNEAWDLNHLGIQENEKGRNCWTNKDWDCAIYYFNRAIQYYRQAKEKNPKEKIYRNNLSNNEGYLEQVTSFKEFDEALALLNKGLNHEAEVAYRNYILKNPRNENAHYNLCVALWNQGLYGEAYDECILALKINPDVANGKEALSKLKKLYANKLNEDANDLYDKGKLSEAEAAYRRAIELNPTDPVLYGNLADAQSEQGKFKEAETTYRKAAEYDPSDIDYKIRLGNSIMDQGRLSEARNFYQELIASNPGIATLYFNLGYILSKEGKSKEAETNYRKAIQIYPDDVNFYYNLGLLLEKQGLYSEAAKEYQNAMKVHPGDKTVQASIDKLIKDGKMTITELTPGSVKDPLSQLVSSQIQGFDVVIDGKGKYYVELSPLVTDGSAKYVEKVPEKLARTEQFQQLLKEEKKIRDEFNGLQRKLDETKKKKEETTGNKSDLEMELVKLKEDMTKKENEFNMNRFKQTEAIRNFHEDFDEATKKTPDENKAGTKNQ